MSDRPVGFGLVGFKGFARTHLGSIDALTEEGTGRLAGVVIIDPEVNTEAVDEFTTRKNRIYHSLDEMLEQGDDIDVVCLPVPIPLHAPFAIRAMEAGKHVICEKPPAATIQDLRAMAEASRRTGKHCIIHFQSVWSPLIQYLKKQVCDGVLGQMKSVITHTGWKRMDSYYQRTYWAGKIKVGDDYVLDGCINNPLAHDLHNCLYLAGQNRSSWARPQTVQGELYRGHEIIESEDTAACRITTDTGTDVYFICTLLAPESNQRKYTLKGSLGQIEADFAGNVKVSLAGKPEQALTVDPDYPTMSQRVFGDMVEVLAGRRERPLCVAEDCEPFVLGMNGTWLSGFPVKRIDPQHLDIHPEDDTVATELPGAQQILDRGAREEKLFSEMDLPWGQATEPVDVRSLDRFDLPI